MVRISTGETADIERQYGAATVAKGKVVNRLKPFMRPFLSRLGHSAPDDIEEIYPEEVEAIQPPAMLDGTIERITGTDERSNFAEQMSHITSETIRHSAVSRITYRNAIACHDGFATWRGSVRFNEGLWADAIWSRGIQLDVLRYPMLGISRTYFGHWLADAVPACFIDPDMGSLMLPNPAIGQVDHGAAAQLLRVMTGAAANRTGPAAKNAKRWHTDDYREIFGLSSVEAPLVFADELVTYRDHGQGKFKGDRYRRMRQILRDTFSDTGKSEGVYIRRGSAGLNRAIQNEDEVCDALSKRGWTVFNIADVTVEELYYHIAGTRVVVGLDGSQMTHAAFMLPDDGALVMLTPPDRFTAVLIDYCRAVGLQPGFVLLDGEAGGYTANLDNILATVDIALSRV